MASLTLENVGRQQWEEQKFKDQEAYSNISKCVNNLLCGGTQISYRLHSIDFRSI
jgi:hypothetical protein